MATLEELRAKAKAGDLADLRRAVRRYLVSELVAWPTSSAGAAVHWLRASDELAAEVAAGLAEARACIDRLAAADSTQECWAILQEYR